MEKTEIWWRQTKMKTSEDIKAQIGWLENQLKLIRENKSSGDKVDKLVLNSEIKLLQWVLEDLK